MHATPLSSPVAWASPDDVFARLEGAWTLARTIEGKASMEGTAVFTRQHKDLLKYREEGRVRLADGKAFDGCREYLYERGPGGFTVLFAEDPPRLFHSIAIMREGDTIVGSGTHLCIADSYDSSYTFLPDGAFVIAHAVNGPRKDYLSRTAFRRRTP